VIQWILNSRDEATVAASVHAAGPYSGGDRETRRGPCRGRHRELTTPLSGSVGRPTGIRWSQVTLFHLGEYIGVPPQHCASMQRYIQERIVERTGIVHAFVLDGSRPKTWTRAAAAVRQAPVNVTFAGIGENGHLAFNEPPADFMTEEPFIVVNLLNKPG
jgi:hypothetical protein